MRTLGWCLILKQRERKESHLRLKDMKPQQNLKFVADVKQKEL